jgi:Tfp pilus assembly protein PilO
LSGFEQKSEDMKTILNEYSLAFPHTAEESSIVILLNKIAEKNALKFNDIRFNEKINKDKLTKIPITINLTGDYFDIIKYIVEIKKLDRVFSISSIVIAREYDGSQNVIADITLNIYNISN